MTISFFVPGTPVAQPRVKFNGHRAYTPDAKAGPAKRAIKEAFKAHWSCDPIDGPVEVDLSFVFPRPKQMIWKSKPMHTVPHDKRPDADNCAKLVLDALNGIAFNDDAQVCRLNIEKVIAAGDEEVGTYIIIKEAV